MGFFGTIVQAASFVIDTVLTIYFWIVIISALLSWVNPDPYNPVVRFFARGYGAGFYRIRRWIPFAVMGGFDLSPIVVILVIQVCKIVVVQNLDNLAFSLARGSGVM